MNRVLKSLAFVGLMCVGTTSWAIPFTTGFTLQGSLDNGNTLCLTGCMGNITVDTNTSQITDIDITIATNNEFLPALNFGNPISLGAPLGFVTFFEGMITAITVSLSSGTDNHLLTITGNEWGIGWNFFGGPPPEVLITGGGSGVRVPEPSIAALLGMGLAVFGFSRIRRRKQTV